MYSPKIAEELVPVLYRLAKERNMPMTRLVDGMLRKELVTIRPPESGAEAGKTLCAPAPEPRKAAA